MCKQTEFKYADGRKPDQKFTSPLRKTRALCVHVPHPKKPGVTVLKPVFDGFCINTNEQYCDTITVMIALTGMRRVPSMQKCPSVFLLECTDTGCPLAMQLS